ncbi:MAG: cell division protein ZapA [Alphaproteobacteria bacterium]|nr:cell division protein ZapA [Alphaproteobacteria bacterium]
MAQVTITINSREYAIVCEDGQESRIIKLSQVLDEKAKQIGGTTQVNEGMLLAMVGLLLADELTETKKKLETSSQSEKETELLKEQDKLVAEEINSLTKKINSIVNSL